MSNILNVIIAFGVVILVALFFNFITTVIINLFKKRKEKVGEK